MANLPAIRKPRVRIGTDGAIRSISMPPLMRGQTVASYMRRDSNPFFWNWTPQLREVSRDVREAYAAACARAIDTIQNSGWVAGAVDQAVASTIGTGLRLTAKPDADALGWTEDVASQWAQRVERRWEGWAMRGIECDVTGKDSIGKLSAQALRTYFCYGEMLAALPFVKRTFNQYGTKVQMLPPHRLMHRMDDTSRYPMLTQGVWRDDLGFPLAYRIEAAADIPAGERNWRDIPARDMWGRAQMVHVFDGFPGQVRGIPPITPALKVVRQYEQQSDATLMASLIQTIFAATIKSPSPTEDVLQAFQDLGEQAAGKPGTGAPPNAFEAMLAARAGWYDSTQIDLGRHGKVAHLAPGDEFNLHASQHPNDTYEAFVRMLLREIARCLGITFEQLTGDYTGATYSSVRMATSEIWQIVLYRRVHLVAPFLQPIYEAWLEEEINNGWVEFPGGLDGYVAMRGAASRAHWRGPAKPQADDLKFAKAIETLRGLGVITDEWICAELGDDWEDTYLQRQREMERRRELGLPEVVPDQSVAGVDPQTGELAPQQGAFNG